MDYNAMAAEIIARIPPLPPLREQAGSGGASTWWRTPDDSACPTTYVQTYNEPMDFFLERCDCYWRRCVSHRLVQAMQLEQAQQRALRDACWAKLVDPKQLPAYPDFWYGDPPREVKTSTWDVGKHQLS